MKQRMIRLARIVRAHLKEAHKAENAADIGYLDKLIEEMEQPEPPLTLHQLAEIRAMIAAAAAPEPAPLARKGRRK